MMTLPVIEQRDNLLILRDDLLPGGTKRRVIDCLLTNATEFVYASPAYGYAQVALAITCRELGLQSTIFTAKRNQLHPRTLEAQAAGAQIIQVPYGYLSNVQSKARRYAAEHNARLLPFGFDTPEIQQRLSALASSLPLVPAEVWTVAGSGTLTRALQQAWPQARFYAVRVGQKVTCGRAQMIDAPEKFEDAAKHPPPFASCANFDAKAWRFITQHASPNALFWNVAA
jgi:cysteine synthase